MYSIAHKIRIVNSFFTRNSTKKRPSGAVFVCLMNYKMRGVRGVKLLPRSFIEEGSAAFPG